MNVRRPSMEPPGDIVRLIEAGAHRAQLVFGSADDVHNAEALCYSGQRHFSPAADAPAVAAILTNDRPTVELVLGAIAGGAEMVSLPIPSRGAPIESYLALIRNACATRGVQNVIARDDIASMLSSVGIGAVPHSELGTGPLSQLSPGGFRLVQFSSGSTRQPKGIGLGAAELGANVSAILEVIEPRPGDAAVSWLPLSHDMGLIGMLLACIAGAADQWAGPGNVVLLDPERFLRRPSLWLDALHEWQGTITAAPDFGYRLACERGDSAPRDLSRLRCAIVGGEIVRAVTLERFAERFADSGVKPACLCPAYGMAEIGLAVSMTRPTEMWRELTVSDAALADSHVAPVSSRNRRDKASRLVASGCPLRGYEIVSAGLQESVGALSIRGPSSGRDLFTGERLCDSDGWLRTGDVGFVADDYVYVCGRSDDYITVHGRNIYLPSVEQTVETVPGVRAGRAGIMGIHDGEWFVVFEAAGDHRRSNDELVEAVRRAVVASSAAQPTGVLLLGRGSVPTTSSGKLQRQELKRRFLRGEFDIVSRTQKGHTTSRT